MTRHIKNLYVNTSLTILTNSTGSKGDVPSFFYKDQMLLQWFINDNTGTGIDLSGGTFEFIVKDTYNGTELVKVANSSFVLGDWSASDITTGKICCRVNLDQTAIQTWLNKNANDNANASLWMTLGGIDYLLVAFNPLIKNIIY